MSQINFDSDRIVIVCYPQWAGGKFLINALGLSTRAVLQDADLATQDINGLLSQQDKFNTLKNRLLNVVTDQWNDLGLGCIQLFGDYVNPLEPIPTLSNSSYHFFVVAHDYKQFSALYQQWNRAKIIVFDKPDKFIKYRREHLKRNYHWQLIRSKQWPIDPPRTLDELHHLDLNIQEEIYKDFGGFVELLTAESFVITNDARKLSTIPNAYYWNNNRYFSKLETVDGIKQLYNYLQLPDFNQEYVSEYYDLWIDQLSKQK